MSRAFGHKPEHPYRAMTQHVTFQHSRALAGVIAQLLAANLVQ
jgi:hypothetical protein